MSQSLNTKDDYQLVLTDTHLLHYSPTGNFYRTPKSSIKHVRVVPDYSSASTTYILKIDDCSLLCLASKPQLLPAYNLITEWLLNDSVQPVLPTLEG